MKNISVITGGAGGMGKAIARELGKDSALLIGDVNPKKLAEAKAQLEETGYEVYTFELDVTDEAEVKQFAEYASSLGCIKNVIHTAGVSPALCSAEMIYKVNCIGTVNVTCAFYECMTSGSVYINFGSVAAYQTDTDPLWIEAYEKWDQPEFFTELMKFCEGFEFDEFLMAGQAYAISKRFVIYFTQKNIERFLGKGVRILSVSPGSYLTPMHQALIDNQPDMAEDQIDLIPTGRWGHPFEMGALISFLCSGGAGYISGVDILADGGQIANLFVPQI